MVYKSFLVDLSTPLSTSPHLPFIPLTLKLIIAFFPTRPLFHHTTRSSQRNPVTQSSRSAQGLSKNVQTIQNDPELTMWLPTESASVLGPQNRADFDST